MGRRALSGELGSSPVSVQKILARFPVVRTRSGIVGRAGPSERVDMSTGSPCFGVEFLLTTLVYLGGGWASLSLLEAGPGKAQDHGHEVKVSSARLTPHGL